jgi:hypothetical protein
MTPPFTCARQIAFGFALLALAACDDGRRPLPDATVRIVNAAPSYGTLAFLREERPEATLAFRESVGFQFDVDQYDFHIETTDLEGAVIRPASTSLELDTEHDYSIVIDESGGLGFTTLTFPKIAPSNSSVQFRVFHAAADIGPVDVYLTAAGVDLAAATSIASLAFGEGEPSVDSDSTATIAAGSYELSLTVAGDPAGVLMRSAGVTLPGGTNLTFVITDPAGIEPVGVIAASNVGGGFTLLDASVESTLRIINAVSNRGPIDVALGEDFTPPFAAGIAFGIPTADLDIESGEQTISVTPAGNSGSLEVDAQEETFVAGNRYLLLVGDDPGEVSAFLSLDDRRPLGDRARIRYLNASAEIPTLNFFAVPESGELTDATPVPIAPNSPFLNIALAPGNYEITVRNPSSNTTLAGPLPVTLAAGGVYSVLATDHASNSNAVDVLLFDDFD